MAINGSSLQFDDEGTSDLTAEIYELDRKKLELGQLIGQVLLILLFHFFLFQENLNRYYSVGLLRWGSDGSYSS